MNDVGSTGLCLWASCLLISLRASSKENDDDNMKLLEKSLTLLKKANEQSDDSNFDVHVQRLTILKEAAEYTLFTQQHLQNKEITSSSLLQQVFI